MPIDSMSSSPAICAKLPPQELSLECEIMGEHLRTVIGEVEDNSFDPQISHQRVVLGEIKVYKVDEDCFDNKIKERNTDTLECSKSPDNKRQKEGDCMANVDYYEEHEKENDRMLTSFQSLCEDKAFGSHTKQEEDNRENFRLT